MDKSEAVRILEALKMRLAEIKDGVDKKTSWKPSERAMTKSLYAREIDAIEIALTFMDEPQTVFQHEQ